MADQRITQLTALPKASVAATDVVPIVDISASETKKVTAKDLVDAGLDLVDASSIDLGKLDQASSTKLGTAALADDAITAAKLADSSSVAINATAPASHCRRACRELCTTTWPRWPPMRRCAKPWARPSATSSSRSSAKSGTLTRSRWVAGSCGGMPTRSERAQVL